MASVSIDIPLAADDENLEHPFIDFEPVIHNFSQASKKTLNRIYNQVHADGTTLTNGRLVDSSSLLFEWIVEQVSASE